MVPADPPVAPGPRVYRPLPLDRGLHLLGSHFRLAYTARHGEQVLQHLDEYIGLTEAAAPVRKRPYQLAQPARLFRRTGETEWERALWAEYGVSAKPQRSLVPDICGPVLTYQTMLRNSNKDDGWGEVDLLGLRPITLTPVVVELKDARGNDTPLRGIVEGAAYALALRKAWPHRLRADWVQALSKWLGPEMADRFDALPTTLDDVPVIVAAPEQYWDRRIGDPLTHTNGRVPPDAWPVLRALISALAERGIRVVCARLRAGARTTAGRPQQVLAQSQPLPDEPILEVAAEGGSISVYGWRSPDHSWWFRVSNSAAALTDARGTTEAAAHVWVPDWDAVLALLDKWPWAMFYPLYVNPAFKDAVLRDSQRRAGEHFRVEAWNTAAARRTTRGARS